MIQQISSEDFQEIETAVEEIQSKFYDFVCLLKDKNIKPRGIEWVNTIGTILGSIEGITQYAFFNVRDKSFESWKEKCLDICEDEHIVIVIEKESGETISVDGKFNVASGQVISEDEHMGDDDIKGITFEWEDGFQTVCLDCGEGVVTISEKDSQKHCSNCG